MPLPIPKAELHLHIEGTLEPELAFELAARNGIELPYADTEELRKAYLFDDLQSFLNLYYSLMTVLRTEEDFASLADAYLTRAATQGVRHAEIFFDPQAHIARGVSIGTVVEGLWRALSVSEERHGISTRLILCFLRDEPAESALLTLEAARPYLDRITGVGLDSAEVGHPPAKFREVYELAASLGLRRVAHAGRRGRPSTSPRRSTCWAWSASTTACARWNPRNWWPDWPATASPSPCAPSRTYACARSTPWSSTRCPR